MTLTTITFPLYPEHDNAANKAAHASLEVDNVALKQFSKKLIEAQLLTGGELEQRLTSGWSFSGFFDEDGADYEFPIPYSFKTFIKARIDNGGNSIEFDFFAVTEGKSDEVLKSPRIFSIDFLSSQKTVHEKILTASDAVVDIETMDTETTSIITSIGISAWDFATGKTVAEFHERIDWRDALARYPEFSKCKGTEAFWIKQSANAQMELTGTRSIEDVLEDLTAWWKTYCPKARIYGNGANFDPVILEHAYAVVTGGRAPWHYSKVSDVRTVVDMGRRFLNIDPKNNLAFTGIKHNALHDARHESQTVKYIFQAFKDALGNRFSPEQLEEVA